MLDGDRIPQGLNKDLGFANEDRSENIRRIAEVAALMNDARITVIVATISPFAKDTSVARAIIGIERFIEVYVSTPIEKCEKRDQKNH